MLYICQLELLCVALAVRCVKQEGGSVDDFF